MTHTYHGLSRVFPYVELKPIKFVVESSNELVYRITCFVDSSMVMLIADADSDAVADAVADADDVDAVAGLMAVSLKLPGKMRQTSMRCRLVPIDDYIEGRRLITCE